MNRLKETFEFEQRSEESRVNSEVNIVEKRERESENYAKRVEGEECWMNILLNTAEYFFGTLH